MKASKCASEGREKGELRALLLDLVVTNLAWLSYLVHIVVVPLQRKANPVVIRARPANQAWQPSLP